jgi:hypothetical protein
MPKFKVGEKVWAKVDAHLPCCAIRPDWYPALIVHAMDFAFGAVYVVDLPSVKSAHGDDVPWVAPEKLLRPRDEPKEDAWPHLQEITGWNPKTSTVRRPKVQEPSVYGLTAADFSLMGRRMLKC